ncbi:unnamed protein product [Nyctereutes procyonoides]|uniref:(raccoon dog) hypothetical protein n=1 Tax=Nyctereutes procyonoides TaxID=34880 RepID=A0A811YYQ8_NYCPR|nr:unnamed protein product [Nyctereutes procyonoides]
MNVRDQGKSLNGNSLVLEGVHFSFIGKINKERGTFDFQRESMNFPNLFDRGTFSGNGKRIHGSYILYALIAISVYTLAYVRNCSVQKLVVVISNTESGEVLERWQFDIECDKTAKDDSTPREKSQKAIQDEIRSVIRQITATVTFLPLLEVSCSFDLLIYTDKDLVVPEKWEESGPQFITNSEEVRLRSFTTTIHKVNSMVAYKIPTSD